MSARWTTYAAYAGDNLDFDCAPDAVSLERAVQDYAKRLKAANPELYPGKPVHDVVPSWYAYRQPRAGPV